ncbi:MAG: FadR family transcriptional regulator [Solirubrobacterales bacterium]|nr:FadR family transcriptional regulator [Solirubrobacterales bacterium]
MTTSWEGVRVAATQIPDGLSATLEKLIRDGSIPHQERLPSERELAARLGVSRTSLRASLRELELKGMVDRRPGRGTVVLNPAETGVGPSMLSKLGRPERDMREVMDLRIVIEPPIAALAAGRATARDIRELHRIVAEMETGGTDRAPELDINFHRQIARSTHNPLLSQLVEFASGWIDETRPPGGFSEQRLARSIEAHRRIVAAIESRDAEASRQAMADHIKRVWELLDPEEEA